MAGRKSELDPSVSSRALFGGELRHYRERVGLSQAGLAAKIPCDTSLISRIEKGERGPRDDFADRCDDLLGTGGALARLWPFVVRREETFPEGFMDYVTAESTATEVHTFEVGYVPGLLQTPAYAAALLSAGGARRDDDPATVEERLALRLNRQKILNSPTPVRFWAVVDESAIRRNVGGRAVMREQLDYLAECAARPNVVIQIAPFSLGERAPLVGASLALLTLPDGSVAAYTESLLRGWLERGRDVVEDWARSYALLQVEALSQADSLLMIRIARRDLSNMTNINPTGAAWRKSTYSGDNGGNCIEVDDAHPGTVRDSKDPSGPALVFGADAFTSFVEAVKAGEFGAI